MTKAERKEAIELFKVLDNLKIEDKQKQFVLGFATCLAYMPKKQEAS